MQQRVTTDEAGNGNTTTTVVVGDRVSIAVLHTPYGEFTGEAKRAPGDRWNYSVGFNLALGRALAAYGIFLESAAHLRSDHLCGHA